MICTKLLTNPLIFSSLHSMQYQKVYLKSFDEVDAEAFMTWASDDEVTKFLTWNSYKSIDEATNFIVNIAKPHPWFKAICIHDKVIGSISLEKMQFEGKEVVEIGYVIARAFWRKGYASKAVEETLRLGLCSTKVNTAISFVDPSNIPSKRVLEKNGFVHRQFLPRYREIKGEWKDRDLYVFDT